MIIPRVKKCEETGRELCFGDILKIYYAGQTAEKLAFAANELLQPIRTEAVASPDEAVLILQCEAEYDNTDLQSLWEQKGSYRICVTDTQIVADGTDFVGGRNALATLSQLLRKEEGCITIPELTIEDYPDASFRSFMHDVGRKYIPIEELKMHLLLMAKCKMNVFHFHFTEYVGFAIALSAYPNLKGPECTGGKQYTEAEIRELVAYATALGIEVIPEIDVPGHANAITDIYHELKCKPVDGRESHGWALCVGNEETYQFLEGLIAEAVKLFPSPYFHIGTDEISMGDVIRTPLPLSDWEDCRVCQELAAREGIENTTQLFNYFVRRMYNILKKLGKHMIMWNDQIDISKSPELPRDILIEFWRVAAPTRGPVEGCSMQRFLEEGFYVINANYPDTYIDLYVEYDKLKEWDYRRSPATDAETPGIIIGGDVCAWDVFAHFRQTVPVSITCFADRFWNRKPVIEEKEFLTGISELLLGEKDLNIFDYMKGVLLLDNENNVFREDIDRQALKVRLEAIEGQNPVTKYMRKLYLEFLDSMNK